MIAYWQFQQNEWKNSFPLSILSIGVIDWLTDIEACYDD